MGHASDPVLITIVEPGSPAAAAGVRPGDRLAALNGQFMRDVIDYQLLREDDELDLTLVRKDRTLHARISRIDGRSIGMALEKSIFDRQKLCQNHCAFCFIDQLPPGCRPTLYIKDDDYRLSFLYGNFITLTNLSRADLNRIKAQRLSPLFASIHATDLEVRRSLVDPPKVDKALDNLSVLLGDGIDVHLQIVACPGINDGERLEETIKTLLRDFTAAASVGIVPVGLTGHRRGLPDLAGFNRQGATALLQGVKKWQAEAAKIKGYRWVYAADEFYLMAGEDIPPAEKYDDFPQVENGIGIARLFVDEIEDWAAQNPPAQKTGAKINLLTASLAANVFNALLPAMAAATGRDLNLIVAANKWLGGEVTVAGLLSGSDVAGAIKAARPVGPVLLPGICLNPDGLFLDDMTVADVAEATGADVRVVPAGGWDFMEALRDV